MLALRDPAPVFRVRLPNYFGSLDILLALVHRNEIDVLDLALSDIVLAYFQELAASGAYDLDAFAEWLSQATALMELKSRCLVPKSAEEEAASGSAAAPRERAVRRKLLEQLAEFKRFQEAGAFAQQRARRERECLRRLADDIPALPADPESRTLRELELWDLVAAFSRVLRLNVAPGVESVVRDPTPISVYQDRLEAQVLTSGGGTLLELIGADNTRPQAIGKFLALLELIKSGRVWVEWDFEANDLAVLPPRAAGAVPATPAAPVASERWSVHRPEKPASDAEPEPPAIWPDLPSVPELPPRNRAWAAYEPLVDEDEGDAERRAA
ncbi:MAG TPA: segregation/condensation protein A [Planctomycetia bacterium]|nr:segregation/condensation protein A [Planctomycetia bacterium]